MSNASSPDPETEMETVTSADGTEIALARSGSGPPLVCVHGLALDHTFWDLGGLRDTFADEFTVYAMNRRGRGESGDCNEYDLEREVEDVAAVVNSIDEPVALLGHSHGALCALEAAARTDSLSHLVLYEPPFMPGEGYPVLEELLDAVTPLLADGEPERAVITDLSAVGLPETYLERLRSSPNWETLVEAADTIPREIERIIAYDFDTERFTGMTTPTLLVAGAESPDRLANAAEIVHETLPDSRIVRIDGGAHFGLLTNADQFVEEARGFLEAT